MYLQMSVAAGLDADLVVTLQNQQYDVGLWVYSDKTRGSG